MSDERNNARLAQALVTLHEAIVGYAEAQTTPPRPQHLLHNELFAETCSLIVRPVVGAGGRPSDVLVVLESTVAAVFTLCVKLGGDEKVFDHLVAGVRKRLAEQRLGPIETKGQA